MSFSVFDSDVVLCSGENVLTCNLVDDKESVIVLPKLQSKNEIHCHNNVEVDLYHATTNVSFSNNGEYFLICTNRKQLCVYKRKTLELVSNRCLVRAASKVRFCPNNDIIVADKTGDVYVFSTNTPEDNGRFLLGHLSMLLDVLVTDDQKYVITTDRDEKIRVSMYPNSYNIAAYCLGHEKFVTNICELPHNKKIMISCGGDGFLKLWDYQHGNEVSSIKLSNNIPENDIGRFTKHLQSCDLDENVTEIPVKHLRATKLNEMDSILAISLYYSNNILMYKVCETTQNQFNITYINAFDVEDEPLDFIFYKTNLWILTNQGLNIYETQGNTSQNDKLNRALAKLNNSWKKLRSNVNEQSLFPILYKRKYDNVQEYQDRKKSRLAKISES